MILLLILLKIFISSIYYINFYKKKYFLFLSVILEQYRTFFVDIKNF